MMIKVISHKFEPQACIWDSMSEVKGKLYSYKQADNESNAMHVKNLKSLYSVVEHYARGMFEEERLMMTIIQEATLQFFLSIYLSN